jgi:broad specificity phosphatase PhoE
MAHARRAGSRDSELTNHGFEQAKRLGTHLKMSGVDLTHIFCSPLQRALITAEQVRAGQTAEAQTDAVFVPMPALQEQEFGLFEGVPIREYHTGDDRHSSVETPESMSKRADAFIDEHLLPLFKSHTACTVGIVSHGCMLRILWQQVLSKVTPKTLSCDQGAVSRNGSLDARNITAWSNTGFLEARFVRNSEPTYRHVQASNIVSPASISGLPATDSDGKDADGYHAEIITINGRPHLDGLTKARGGVGNARYDARQTSLRQYFATDSG